MRSKLTTQQAAVVKAVLRNDGDKAVKDIGTETMLKEIESRGGHPAALARAALLCIRKSADYNSGQSDPHTIDRTGYFPFGTVSYAQMIHTKSERFMSLTRKQLEGQDSNFEGLGDTALDIINYAGFFLADPRKDIVK